MVATHIKKKDQARYALCDLCLFKRHNMIFSFLFLFFFFFLPLNVSHLSVCCSCSLMYLHMIIHWLTQSLVLQVCANHVLVYLYTIVLSLTHPLVLQVCLLGQFFIYFSFSLSFFFFRVQNRVHRERCWYRCRLF